MSLVIPLSEIPDRFRPSVGGKAFALAALIRAGLAVPDGVCVVREAYEGLVRETGLRERILLELNRKPYDQIPCVTGVPDAAELIDTGGQVTVDGYLGVVTVTSQGASDPTSV